MDLNQAQYDPSVLFHALSIGDLNTFNHLMSVWDAPVDCPDNLGLTLLQYAATFGYYSVCEQLIERGANINVGNEYNCPLMLATKNNDFPTVCLLMEHGAIIDMNSYNAADEADSKGYKGISDFIHDYLMKDILNNFIVAQSIKGSLHFPMELRTSILQLRLSTNRHPVRLILLLQYNDLLLQNLGKVIDILIKMSEQQFRLKNEKLSWMFHLAAFYFAQAQNFLYSQKQFYNFADMSDQQILDELIKKWIKDQPIGSYSPTLLNVMKIGIMSYPIKNTSLYKAMMVTSISLMPDNYYSVSTCETCRDQSNLQVCSQCQRVRYCSRNCQRLHWIHHKNECKNVDNINLSSYTLNDIIAAVHI